MTKNVAVGTFTFVLLYLTLGVTAFGVADLTGAPPVAGHIAAYGLALPLALVAALRAGSLTHGWLLGASVVAVLACTWLTWLILDAVAGSGGGQVAWIEWIRMGGVRAAAEGLGMVLAPQLWLWLFRRMAANNLSKPTPLRGAA